MELLGHLVLLFLYRIDSLLFNPADKKVANKKGIPGILLGGLVAVMPMPTRSPVEQVYRSGHNEIHIGCSWEILPSPRSTTRIVFLGTVWFQSSQKPEFLALASYICFSFALLTISAPAPPANNDLFLSRFGIRIVPTGFDSRPRDRRVLWREHQIV